MKLLLAILFSYLAFSSTLFATIYSTTFPLNQNPIYENGNWLNGGTSGLDWTNVYTVLGTAYGTQSGAAVGAGRYADFVAVLAGNWGANQTAQAAIVVNNASGDSGVLEEVELYLRTTITPHSITGYEIIASVSTNPDHFYVQIVRWNGPLGNFTFLDARTYHVANGDTLKSTAIGNVITLYVNGVEIFHVVDNTYNSGSPGIGFFLQGATGLNANYGLSSFSAWDDTSSTPSPTPTPSQTPYAAWEASLITQMQTQGIPSYQINATQSWLNDHPPYP